MPADASMPAETSSKPMPVSTEEKIRRLQAEVTRIQQLAELKALEKQLAILAKDHETETGYAERLVDDIKRDLLSSPDRAGTSSSKRARSPDSDSVGGSPQQRPRNATSLSDDAHSATAVSTSAGPPASPTKSRHTGRLRPEDIKWLTENEDKYRGLGRRESISWQALLLDKPDLAQRMTAHQCSTAWTQHKVRLRERSLCIEGRARLQSNDIEWLKENVERYRGPGKHDRISWVRLLADNKDLGSRMSADACAAAWRQYLMREKRREGRGGKSVRDERDELEEEDNGWEEGDEREDGEEVKVKLEGQSNFDYEQEQEQEDEDTLLEEAEDVKVKLEDIGSPTN